MAYVRLSTNTQGTQPVVVIGISGSNLANTQTSITVPAVQDITITNSTGVYTYTTFSDVDQRKLSTPANNELGMNVIIDKDSYFGNASASANSAAYYGIAYLSQNKIELDFQVYWTGNTSGNTDPISTGSGFITNLAAKTTPTAPVWITPMNIAVDGTLTTGLTG